MMRNMIQLIGSEDIFELVLKSGEMRYWLLLKIILELLLKIYKADCEI